MSKKIANLWIIDDDPMTSFYIKRLTELGELASIITIYDKARGAVEYLLHHRQSIEYLPDIILLDIYMPDLDGWGLTGDAGGYGEETGDQQRQQAHRTGGHGLSYHGWAGAILCSCLAGSLWPSCLSSSAPR